MIDKAFILAAGFGKRLRPHTTNTPKPLVEVSGKSLLAHTIDRLEAAGVKEIVVNSHYLAEQIDEAVQTRTGANIHVSYEDKLLDTGGGIKNALKVFGNDPFYVLSGDGLWDEGPKGAALEALSEAWDPEKMDILLLLQPVESMSTTHGVGDYDLDSEGRCTRSLDQTGAHMWTSIRIHHPRVFENTPDGAFSYLQLLDKAQDEGRLYGVIHDGLWHHISTPDDLESVRKHYEGKDERHA